MTSARFDFEGGKCANVVLDYIRAMILDSMDLGMRGLWAVLDCGHKCSLSTVLRICDENWGLLLRHSGFVRTDGRVQFKLLEKVFQISNWQFALRTQNSDGQWPRLTFIRFMKDIFGSDSDFSDKDEIIRTKSEAYESEENFAIFCKQM